jgi:hypothetical protein
MGISRHLAWLGSVIPAGDGAWGVWPPGRLTARIEASMQSDPFLDFHRTAEAGGYPAMLVVSVFALALVVAPVALLALTQAVWVLVLAVLSIFAALCLLAGAFGAALADADDPPEPPQGTTSPRRIA